MSTTGLIDKIKTLPLEECKAVLKILSEELEEDVAARLYEERSKEPDGPTLASQRRDARCSADLASGIE